MHRQHGHHGDMTARGLGCLTLVRGCTVSMCATTGTATTGTNKLPTRPHGFDSLPTAAALLARPRWPHRQATPRCANGCTATACPLGPPPRHRAPAAGPLPPPARCGERDMARTARAGRCAPIPPKRARLPLHGPPTHVDRRSASQPATRWSSSSCCQDDDPASRTPSGNSTDGCRGQSGCSLDSRGLRPLRRLAGSLRSGDARALPARGAPISCRPGSHTHHTAPGHTPPSQAPAMHWLTVVVRVRVNRKGSQNCRNVGKSQSLLDMINPIIFTRTRSS
jgi:hypothetical protein